MVSRYLFTSDSVDRQVDHRIYKDQSRSPSTSGGSACHHCRIVPDDEQTSYLLPKVSEGGR